MEEVGLTEVVRSGGEVWLVVFSIVGVSFVTVLGGGVRWRFDEGH